MRKIAIFVNQSTLLQVFIAAEILIVAGMMYIGYVFFRVLTWQGLCFCG